MVYIYIYIYYGVWYFLEDLLQPLNAHMRFSEVFVCLTVYIVRIYVI